MFNRSYIAGHEEHLHFIPDQTLSKLKKAFRQVKNQEETITLIKALSDSTKFSIILLLTEVEELAVTDISEILDLSQSAVSHALADLKKLDIVDCKRCGQLRCYFLKEQVKGRTSVLQQLTKVLT